jgi:hypothetical protein
MKYRYLVAFAVVTSLLWLVSARAETLSSKLTDAVSAATAGDSQAASDSQATTARADGTEREALTNEARDAADRALETSRNERK